MSTAEKKDVLLKVILLGDHTVGKTSLWDRICSGIFPSPSYNTTFWQDFFSHKIKIKHTAGNIQIQYLLTLQIWDTFSQERFGSMGIAYYRGTDCAIIMYDVTNRESFKNVKLWMDELLEFHHHGTEIDSIKPKISIAIVGNKSDLEHKRQVSRQELYDLCELYGTQDEYFRINKTEHLNKCELLCYGFVRECDMGSIPLDIYQLCFKFHFEYGIKSTIHPFEISVKAGHGINEMIEKLVRTLLDISHYHKQSLDWTPPMLNLNNQASNNTNVATYTAILGLAGVSCALLYKYFR